MFSTTLKRSAATLGVVAGLLAAAVPASAATMLDYEGNPVVTYSAKDGSSSDAPRTEARVGGKMHLEDVSLGIRGDAQDTQTWVR
jgi:hypothetical protein